MDLFVSANEPITIAIVGFNHDLDKTEVEKQFYGVGDITDKIQS